MVVSYYGGYVVMELSLADEFPKGTLLFYGLPFDLFFESFNSSALKSGPVWFFALLG